MPQTTPESIGKSFETMTSDYPLDQWTFRNPGLRRDPTVIAVSTKITDIFFRMRSHPKTLGEFKRWMTEAAQIEVSPQAQPPLPGCLRLSDVI